MIPSTANLKTTAATTLQILQGCPVQRHVARGAQRHKVPICKKQQRSSQQPLVFLAWFGKGPGLQKPKTLNP